MTNLPLIPKFLLRTNFTSLHSRCVPINPRLPSRSSDIPDTARGSVVEDCINFFQSLHGCFGEEEEYVDECCRHKDAEDNVHFPADVRERWWDEVGESKVKRWILLAHILNSP